TIHRRLAGRHRRRHRGQPGGASHRLRLSRLFHRIHMLVTRDFHPSARVLTHGMLDHRCGGKFGGACHARRNVPWSAVIIRFAVITGRDKAITGVVYKAAQER
ncbi:MAG: hypothetical protein VXB94_05790, partial [Rhodobiaceae bacterium]